MLFDGFTVAAQALNFLILVFLMRRFLYKPVLHAIDERERRIAAELADADDRRAEAKASRDAFQAKNADLDQRRAALLSQATEEAKAERQRLLDEARKAADDLGNRRRETLQTDARALSQAIAEQTGREVFAVARKALKDLAGVQLEAQLGEAFSRRLRDLDAPTRATFGDALKVAKNPAVVRSAFELSDAQRAALQNAINETFAIDARLRFDTAPDLVGGIELSTDGLKVGWSIAEYLSTLEARVGALLKTKRGPTAGSTPKPTAAPAPAGGPT